MPRATTYGCMLTSSVLSIVHSCCWAKRLSSVCLVGARQVLERASFPAYGQRVFLGSSKTNLLSLALMGDDATVYGVTDPTFPANVLKVQDAQREPGTAHLDL